MSPRRSDKDFSRAQFRARLCLLLAVFFIGWLVVPAKAGIPPPGDDTNLPSYTPLNYFWFNDVTNWSSSRSNYPALSFSNISAAPLGDGSALDMNFPGEAWLNFGITNASDGSTNLTVAVGAISLWYAAGWAGTNQGGEGPAQIATLLSIGSFTPDSSAGWWCLYLDPSGTTVNFAAQTNDGSGNCFIYLTAPVAFTTNVFHNLVFCYSATNSAIYIDGALAEIGPPITNYPGASTLAGGFYIGSAGSGGTNECLGLLDDIYTYSVPLDPVTISDLYFEQSFYFIANPLNLAEDRSGTNYPAFSGTNYNVISGQGNLTWISNATGCVTSTNVWFTNFTAWAVGSGTNRTRTVQFAIAGGESGWIYDVFANSMLSLDPVRVPWAWIGSGTACQTYEISGLPNTTCFLILGTPQDTSGQGLTDAFEELVLQISPSGPQFDSYDVPYAWYAEYGLIPVAGMATQDPDQDALLNYQEYLYGTNPQISEGFTFWIGSPNGGTGIP